MADDREHLGRAAVGAHIEALAEQEHPPWQDRPPTWEELSDSDRDFYMRIGHAVAVYALAENAATYGISCTSCAAHLDRANVERERAERAEARLAEVAAYVREHKGDAGLSWMHALDVLAITGPVKDGSEGEAGHG